MALAGVAHAQADWLKGNTEEQLRTLAGLQPGLGTSLDPLGKAIEAKDVKKFETAFKATQQARNVCHAAAGFAFIWYELPKESASLLSNKP